MAAIYDTMGNYAGEDNSSPSSPGVTGTPQSQMDAQDLENGYVSSPVGTMGSVVSNKTTTNTTSVPLTPKKPAPCVDSSGTSTPIPNPLNNYASYSYAWSMWWLSIDDYNELMNFDDVGNALNWDPTVGKSFVVAEDSGRFPDRRLPGALPVNYHIQSVNFNTLIAPSQDTRSSNLIDGSMLIVEPYGVTFLDQLCYAAASFAPAYDDNNNYTTQPYMLQLDFFGYDDTGKAIPTSDHSLRKRFPIQLLTVGLEANSSGSKYNITYTANGHLGHGPIKYSIPNNITITADTVGTALDALAAAVNGFFQIDAYAKKNATYADNMKFDIDPAIYKSPITYGKGVPMGDGVPSADDIDTSKLNFSIKSGTTILAIIDRIMAQSQYLAQQLKTVGNGTDPKIQNDIFNAYKTTVSVRYAGTLPGGEQADGVYDSRRQCLPLSITYKLGQHPSWKCENPNGATLSDSTLYTAKTYNYLYTGKNVDVIDFSLNFDMSYYSSVLGYTDNVSGSEVTGDTATDSEAAKKPPNFVFNPALMLKNVPNISPQRYRYILGDQNLTVGGGVISNPTAQKSADMIKSIYGNSAGDMIAVDLTIIGDPTLIKQDDWLYVASPTNGTVYNSWDSMSQYEFAKNYGHIRMDAGEVVVSVIVNSPIDLDTDLTNQGLVYPQMGVNNQYQTLFSGQYMINTIENKFEDGKFIQVLHLVRYINGDPAKANTQSLGSTRSDTPETVSKSQTDQQNSTPAYQTAPQTSNEKYDAYRDAAGY